MLIDAVRGGAYKRAKRLAQELAAHAEALLLEMEKNKRSIADGMFRITIEYIPEKWVDTLELREGR